MHRRSLEQTKSVAASNSHCAQWKAHAAAPRSASAGRLLRRPRRISRAAAPAPGDVHAEETLVERQAFCSMGTGTLLGAADATCGSASRCSGEAAAAAATALPPPPPAEATPGLRSFLCCFVARLTASRWTDRAAPSAAAAAAAAFVAARRRRRRILTRCATSATAATSAMAAPAPPPMT